MPTTEARQIVYNARLNRFVPVAVCIVCKHSFEQEDLRDRRCSKCDFKFKKRGGRPARVRNGAAKSDFTYHGENNGQDW